MTDFDDLKPDEKLFELASLKGDARAPLLAGDHIMVASRMLKRDPERYAKLLGKMAGWHSLSAFKQRVQKLRADADANLKKKKAEAKIEERVEQARQAGRPVIALDAPVAIARDFVGQVMPHLIRTKDDFLEYHENAYRPVEELAVRSAIQWFLERAVDADSGAEVHPDKYLVDKVFDAVRNVAFRDQYEAKPPTWFDYWEGVDPDPKTCIAARNGILDVHTETLLPLTPRFFTRNGLSFAYDPEAAEPIEWLNFLDSIWPLPEGQANHDTLQEIVGHLLTGDTKYQKIFLLVGSSRGGKGVTMKVIEQLVGSANVAEQSLNKLGREFGLAALLGKQVLMVGDMRLGRNADVGAITETLLNISGEDRVSIGVKFRDDEQVRLNTRIILAGNLELVLPDKTGALARRYVPLVFKKSFAGREDFELVGRLLAELPSIMNWALAGLRRLEARRDPATGRPLGFVQTPDGQKLLDKINRRGASVLAFVAECCDLVDGESEPKDTLFEAFEEWCREREVEDRHSLETFARELYSVTGHTVDSSKAPRAKGRRPIFTGIRLRNYGY